MISNLTFTPLQYTKFPCALESISDFSFVLLISSLIYLTALLIEVSKYILISERSRSGQTLDGVDRDNLAGG